MEKPQPQKRRIQTEIEFRNHNLRERKQFERYMNGVQASTAITRLVCECADETCSQKIGLTVKERQGLSGDAAHFVVVPGHVDPEIEKVIVNNTNYQIVEKFALRSA